MKRYIDRNASKTRQDARKWHFWAYWLGRDNAVLFEASDVSRARKLTNRCTVVYRSENVYVFHPLENRLDDWPVVYDLVDFAIALDHNMTTIHKINLGDDDNPEITIPPA